MPTPSVGQTPHARSGSCARCGRAHSRDPGAAAAQGTHRRWIRALQADRAAVARRGRGLALARAGSDRPWLAPHPPYPRALRQNGSHRPPRTPSEAAPTRATARRALDVNYISPSTTTTSPQHPPRPALLPGAREREPYLRRERLRLRLQQRLGGLQRHCHGWVRGQRTGRSGPLRPLQLRLRPGRTARARRCAPSAHTA